MITIHKYVFSTAAAEVEIPLPKDAQLLSVHLQGNQITLIGTVLSGRFVWHVFDMGEI